MSNLAPIKKMRQSISERISEINNLPAPIDESGIKPEMRKKLEGGT